MLARHSDGAFVQIAGASVVAQPRPLLQHMIERRGGQRLHGRPALEEPLEIGRHRRHRGLLQHDFRQPDAIGIGGFALAAPATAGCGGGGRTRPAAPARCPAISSATASGAAACALPYRRERRKHHKARAACAASAQRCPKSPASTPASARRWRNCAPSGPTSRAATWPAQSLPEKLLGLPRGKEATATAATLRIRCSGVAALELQHRQSELIDRINAFFGYRAIDRIVLSQGPAAHAGQTALARAAARCQNPQRHAAGSRAVQIPELRAALKRLADAIAKGG